MASMLIVIIVLTILTALFHISLMNNKATIIITLLTGMFVWWLYPYAIIQNNKALDIFIANFSVANIATLIIFENILLLGANWFQMHQELEIEHPLKPKWRFMPKTGRFFPGITLFLALFYVEIQFFLANFHPNFTLVAIAIVFIIVTGLILSVFLLKHIIPEKIIRIEISALLRSAVMIMAIILASAPTGHRQLASAEGSPWLPLFYLAIFTIFVATLGYLHYQIIKKRKTKI